ncbi:GPW/gp25 family protein, partial [Candidatus Magnetobacterium casense]
MTDYPMQGRFMPNPVLGKGMKFPYEVTPEGGVAVAEGEELINAAIWQVLGTRCAVGDTPGEDETLPTFGSQISACLYLKIGPQTKPLIMAYVINAIKTWIRQVEIGEVRFLSDALDDMGNSDNFDALEDIEKGIERVNISYTILATQQPGNCVYPFYLDNDLRIMGYGEDYCRGEIIWLNNTPIGRMHYHRSHTP